MLRPEVNFRELIPDDGVYRGNARVSFREPDGVVSGPAALKIQPDGSVALSVDVEDFEIPEEYHGFVHSFIEGGIPERGTDGRTVIRIGGGRERQCGLEIDAPQGHLRAATGLVANSSEDLGVGKVSFEAVPFDLELVTPDPQKEEIWCVPLVGNLHQFYGCANACMVPQRLPYAHFEAEGYDNGLLIFRSERDGYGAVAFGEIGPRATGTAGEIRELIPWGLFAAIQFASGEDVSLPWIELRARDGSLVRRLHQRSGGSGVGPGFGTFTRFDFTSAESGVAEFLRLFFAQPFSKRRSLTPILSLVRHGTPGSVPLDNSITDLVRALDAICGRHGVDRVNLAGMLDPDGSAAVSAVLSDAREGLKEIRRATVGKGKVDQAAVLDKIISKLANAAGAELDFGIALGEVLRKFGLHDSEAMEAHYSQNSVGTSWRGLLSTMRGEVIHSGAIQIENRAELLSWFEFARHLHDICKRLVLKEVGYTGTYMPSNVLSRGSYSLDRIGASAAPSEMGYTVLPSYN